MDLERGIIKALFYDYKIERLLSIMEGTLDRSCLLEFVPEILRQTMPAFDVEELRQTMNAYKEKWAADYADYEETSWPLLFVATQVGRMLTMEAGMPRVRKEQLLRWRMISLLVSEDLLSLSWLALEEKDNAAGRADFVWEDTLSITAAEWNTLTKGQSLSDLHSHLGASSDAFNIRWIYWMNNRTFKPEPKRKPSRIQDVGMEWAAIAAVIRYYLFEVCNGNGVMQTLREDILESFREDVYWQLLVDSGYEKIGSAKHNSLKPNIGRVEHWDYAITDELGNDERRKTSPYMLHVGERYIMYEFLRRLYRGEQKAKEMAEYFYLYLLIKCSYRKYFLQTNEQVGLSNYQEYEGENKQGLDNMGEARKRYALQTAIGEKGQHYVESRISWKWDKKGEKSPIPTIHIEKSLFGNKLGDREKLLRRVRLVVSYSKSDFRHEDKNNELKALTNTYEEILQRMLKNKALKDKEFSIVGIDFTGSDEKARPEVYAQLVRYARRHQRMGLKQFTYHAGEDFYDLLDGIRTIDEVLRYLKWDEHCRIGHALALGTNPMHYYELRGWNVITTRQVLLDNLVWFVQMCDVVRYRIGKVQREEIEDKIQSLYEEIGYSEDFDLGKYTDSMRLRGDHPIGAGRAEGLSLFAQTALDDNAALEALRGDAEVSTMFHEYYNDKNIRKEGEDLTFWKMPREMVGAVSRIQKYLFHKIATKRIAIETCPTSNYMIGYFDKYIDLPLFTFMEQLPDNAISINTDDKGIIATSVENEYALVSAVMEKSRKYKGKANEVIERVVKDARKSRFNVP